MNIAVFGDTIIDRHLTINSVKENYEQPGTLKANVSFRHTTPGGAANVAVNVQALSKFGPNDNAVTLYTAGARGDDYAIVREQLLLAGVTPIVSSTRVRPVIKCRLTNNDITETMSPRITRFDVDPYDHWLTSSVNLIGSEEAGNDLKWPSDVDVFVVSDYHKGFFGLEPRSGDVRARIVNAATDKLLIVDPGRHIPGRHLSNWQAWGSKDTIFKFNERQAREFLAFSEQPIAPDAEPEMVYRTVYDVFNQKTAEHGVLFKHLVITFGDKDPQEISKRLVDFSKTNAKWKPAGVIFEGQVYGEDFVKQLAKLPSRKELLTQLVLRMNSPIQGFANVLGALTRNLVVALEEVRKKKAAAGAAS